MMTLLIYLAVPLGFIAGTVYVWLTPDDSKDREDFDSWSDQ